MYLNKFTFPLSLVIIPVDSFLSGQPLAATFNFSKGVRHRRWCVWSSIVRLLNRRTKLAMARPTERPRYATESYKKNLQLAIYCVKVNTKIRLKTSDNRVSSLFSLNIRTELLLTDSLRFLGALNAVVSLCYVRFRLFYGNSP